MEDILPKLTETELRVLSDAVNFYSEELQQNGQRDDVGRLSGRQHRDWVALGTLIQKIRLGSGGDTQKERRT